MKEEFNWLHALNLQPELGSRALFPSLTYASFLAHAAISPLNLVAERACSQALSRLAQEGSGSFLHFAEGRSRLRQKIATSLSVAPEQVGLTLGTTRGITDVALALPLQKGDRLITFNGEFPANVVPYQKAAALCGASVHLLPAPQAGQASQILSQVEAEFKRGARALCVSAVQFQTGLKMPLHALGALCAQYDVLFLVDAIQQLGVSEISLPEIQADAVFTGAHKWLLGLEGVGYLALSPRLLAELQPQTLGWLSFVQAEDFLFAGPGHLDYQKPIKKGADVFEGSTTNTLGYVALEASFDLLSAFSPGEIFNHTQALFDQWEAPLVELGFQSHRATSPTERSSLLSLTPPAGVSISHLTAALRQRGVLASSPDGLLRLAPHFSNSSSETPILLTAVQESLKELTK